MPTTSTIPAFRVALATAIADADPTVQVRARWSGPDMRHEGIYFGEDRFVHRIDEIVPTGTRATRDEEIQVDVYCEAWRAATSPSSSATDDPAGVRAYELFAIVENVIAEDPAVTRSVIAAVQPMLGECKVIPFEKGYAVQLKVIVSAFAHLT